MTCPLEMLEGLQRLSSPEHLKSLARIDMRALLKHYFIYQLGKVSLGTFRVWEDGSNLLFTIAPSENNYSINIFDAITCGKVNQAWIEFRIVADCWGIIDGITLRELLTVELHSLLLIAPLVYHP